MEKTDAIRKEKNIITNKKRITACSVEKTPQTTRFQKTSVREDRPTKTVQQSASIQGKEWFGSACLIPMRHVVFITN